MFLLIPVQCDLRRTPRSSKNRTDYYSLRKGLAPCWVLPSCPRCGNEVTPDASFCTKCGQSQRTSSAILGQDLTLSPDEQQFALFLLPNERLLFWAPGATLHPTQASTGSMSYHPILTYEAGMYQGRDMTIPRSLTGGARQVLSGTLLLTDKRMLLIHEGGVLSKNILQLEVFYDADLIKQLVNTFTERNKPYVEKARGGYFAKTKMFYTNQLGKIVSSVYVLTDFVPEKKLRLARDRGSILATAIGHKMKSFTVSSLMLHTGGKADDAPGPVKAVYHEDYGFTLSKPWSAGAFLLAATDIIWYAALAIKYRTKASDYDPILEIVESRKQAMADLIGELGPPKG